MPKKILQTKKVSLILDWENIIGKVLDKCIYDLRKCYMNEILVL